MSHITISRKFSHSFNSLLHEYMVSVKTQISLYCYRLAFVLIINVLHCVTRQKNTHTPQPTNGMDFANEISFNAIKNKP